MFEKAFKMSVDNEMQILGYQMSYFEVKNELVMLSFELNYGEVEEKVSIKTVVCGHVVGLKMWTKRYI